jgi:F0F1-type ATP synthase membrane subunit c/vacuolar-type H+-ATPase subunit K
MSSPSARSSSAENTGVSSVALWFGLFGAPALWSLQVMAGFAIAAHGCFPRALPLASPTFDVRALTLLITVVAALGAIAAGLTAHASWRRVAHDAGAERTQFMAFSGILVSALFLLAIVLSFVSISMVPPCSYGA